MVDDATAGAERVQKAGGQVINGPMEVPGGDWIAQGIDPQGAMFAIHSAKQG
jgi:predicted enzyme related to lactoylglutathione lyase